MKFILLLPTIIMSAATATKVIEEDTNSPTISYLLAKIEQLESTVANKLITRQISRRSSNVATEKKTSDGSPSSVVTYTRWGNSSCPYGANTVYGGVAAGGANGHKGSPANMMCLPPTPMRYPNNVGGSYYAYGVEYKTGGPIDHANDRNMPCAVCEVTGKSTTLMIPSHYECPSEWREEYKGYIMAGHYNQEGCSMYNCIDISLEQIPGTGGDQGWHHLYPIYVVTSSYSLPYDSGYALSCVVCSK